MVVSSAHQDVDLMTVEPPGPLGCSDTAHTTNAASAMRTCLDVSTQKSFPQSPTKQSTKKMVTFSDLIEVVETEHFRDMSPKERAVRWFTRDDFWWIKMDVLDHMKVGRHFGWDSSSHAERTFINAEGNIAVVTMRGIRSEASSRQRRHDQQETSRAVLNEQMLQRSEGITTTRHLPEVTAMLYNLLSFSCQQRALEMGFKDAMSVYGSEKDYQILPDTKNVLCEPMPMDADMLCVEESFVRHLAERGLKEAGNSLEDWLFERYQRGQQLAQKRACSDQVIAIRAKSCATDHVSAIDKQEDAMLQRV